MHGCVATWRLRSGAVSLDDRGRDLHLRIHRLDILHFDGVGLAIVDYTFVGLKNWARLFNELRFQPTCGIFSSMPLAL